MLILLRPLRTLNATLNNSNPISFISARKLSDITNDFEHEFHKHFIPTTFFQKVLLGLGSATVSIFDPTRPEMIACLAEATGYQATKYILGEMENSMEGSEILRNRPRINSRTVDLEKLRTYPEGTLGKIYVNFLETNNVTPDSRTAVQFVEDVNLAYVMQRYREVHDLVHAVLQMPTNMIGEITVKWVEAIQTKLPMCVGAAVFGPLRLKPKNRQTYTRYYLPWAIRTGKEAEFLLNIYYEKRWEQPLTELYKELNVKPLVLPEKQ